MSATDLLTAINALNELIRAASAVGSVIAQAQAENRPLSAVELRAIREQRDNAIAGLDAEIAKAEAEGR